MIVMKFGGGTLATSRRVNRCLDLIEQQKSRDPVVVVSAHGATTNQLVAAANSALSGEIKTNELWERHLELARGLSVAEGLVQPLLDNLEALLHGIGLIRELTPRTLDKIMSFGERLSARIVAGALAARGVRAVPLCAYDIGLQTNSRFGDATPLESSLAELSKNLSKQEGVSVVTGFVGKDAAGDITTLGRSGSDFSATYIARAIKAEEVVIYKDVDGVMTADPSLEAAALNIPELSFDEASELAYFGAEVLHPATLLPAIEMEIPVRVVNAFSEDQQGTVIRGQPKISQRIAKSVVYKEGVTLFHLDSPRLHSVPEILDKALHVLEEQEVVAHMIATSEAGISLISRSGLDDARRSATITKLEKLAPLKCCPDMGIICLVGEELRGKADAIGKIFTRLAEAGINGRVITRSASEINLAFLVADSEIASAVHQLHNLVLESGPSSG
jgi:aspartate kinase